MGMYDEVSNYVAKKIIKDCPLCGKYLYDIEEPAEWQTKSFESLLQVIGVEDIDRDEFEMHTICPHCNNYFSLNVDMLSSTYKLSSRLTDDVDTAKLFEDTELTDEYINAKLTNTFKDGTENWLKELDIGHDIYEVYDKYDFDTKSELLDMLIDNYYIIPKKSVEGLE